MNETMTEETHPILLPNFERVTVIDHVSDHKGEWLDARKGKIGASEIATIVGLNPYKTPLHLWHEMTGRIDAKNLDDNDAVWIGNELEDTVAKFYTRKTGAKTVKYDRMVMSGSEPWASATPDYVILGDHSNSIVTEVDELLECKVTGEYNLKAWEKGVPDNYHLQAIWQMGIAGFNSATVAAFIGGRALRYHSFPFDRIIFDMLFEQAEAFMRHNIGSDTPPAATERDSDLLESPEKGKVKTLECLSLLENYVTLYKNYLAQNKLAQALEKQAKDIKAQIRQEMGDAATGLCGPYKVSAAKVSVAEKMHAGYEYVRVGVKDTTAVKDEE